MSIHTHYLHIDLLAHYFIDRSTVSTWSYAAKLQPLQALTLHRPDDECDALLLSGSAQVPIAAAVEANEETLTRLTLYGDGIWDCPLRSLLRLQELELILPISLNGFEHVMAQCAELRYLTLDLKSGSRHFVRMVQAHPTTLPLLTAFKLLGTNADDAGSIALADFLRDKKNLRMLDFGWLRNEEVVEDGPEGGLPLPLLEVLPQLPALEVLGLTVARNRLTPATIRFLAQYIPPQLSALMLRLESRVFFEVNGAAEEWTNLVRHVLICNTQSSTHMRRYVAAGRQAHLAAVSARPEQSAARGCQKEAPREPPTVAGALRVRL